MNRSDLEIGLGKLGIRQVSASLYNINRIKNRPMRAILKALFIPIAIVHVRFARTIPYVEMDVTSRCTLNCKECTHLIPTHRSMGDARDYDTDELLENIGLLCGFAGQINMFRLLGGEPFLNSHLHLIIDELSAIKKVKQIQIVTNGTIIPKGDNLSSLKNKKVSVSISNYGELSTKKDELRAALENNGVIVFLEPHSHKWIETDGVKHRGYSSKEVKDVFYKCNQGNCKTLYQGKLWICPFAFNGAALGLLPDCEENYINLREIATEREFWKYMIRMYNVPPRQSASACHHCKCGGYNSRVVECAEQA